MPIVKFILKSLPLESIITKGDEIPKVIDFACGAGHFLNEYAKEIKPIVEKEKEAKITDFYEHILWVVNKSGQRWVSLPVFSNSTINR